MTPSELKRLRELCEKATESAPHRWRVSCDESDYFIINEHGHVVAEAESKSEAEYIVNACAALPVLLDEVERLREAVENYRGGLSAGFGVACEDWAAREIIVGLAHCLALRVVQESHATHCLLVRMGEPVASMPRVDIENEPCTCGLHARKAEARKLLDGTNA